MYLTHWSVDFYSFIILSECYTVDTTPTDSPQGADGLFDSVASLLKGGQLYPGSRDQEIVVFTATFLLSIV